MRRSGRRLSPTADADAACETFVRLIEAPCYDLEVRRSESGAPGLSATARCMSAYHATRRERRAERRCGHAWPLPPSQKQPSKKGEQEKTRLLLPLVVVPLCHCGRAGSLSPLHANAPHGGAR